MFSLFRKDPLQKLKKTYARHLEQARDLQRNGDIRGFSEKYAQAEELLQKIEQLEQTEAARLSG